jgi:SOS response regulatory protein OraA/RecX
MTRFGFDSESITHITPHSRDPNLRRIHVGRKAVATLRAADVAALGLEVGRTWTDELAEAVRREQCANEARRVAMKALGRRAFASGELLELLVRKKHDSRIARRIVDELVADKWIDDESYAKSIADEIRRTKPASSPFIVAKLRSRQLGSRVAEAAAADALKGVDPLSTAMDFATRRFQSMKFIPSTKAMRRIADLLARRGFDDDVIAAVLDRMGLRDSS